MLLEVDMENLKKSHTVFIPCSQTAWFKFQMLAHDEGTTPRLALRDLVRGCVERGYIISKKKKRGKLSRS